MVVDLHFHTKIVTNREEVVVEPQIFESFQIPYIIES